MGTTVDGLDHTILELTCEAKHTWTVKISYNIKVKAKDIYDKESVWSDPLPITMPYSV